MGRRGVPWLAVRLLLLAAAVVAQQTHSLVSTGLSGDPAYAEEFHRWATTLIDAATGRYELPAENVIYLAEKTDVDPARVDDRSTRENVERAFATIAERARPNDYVLVLLIGHGTYSSGESRFNLPGRDLTAQDYARLLEGLGSQQVAFVNAATASGGFIEVLSGEGRTVVTATRSGGQWNATVFGGYFVEAFADGEEDSDQNKDGRVSVLEAFEYAVAQVARVYESDGRLQTEHALLDDNGDGMGTPADWFRGVRTQKKAKGKSSADGKLSRLVFPVIPPAEKDIPAPLRKKRLAAEAKIETLRSLKKTLDAETYYSDLEKLFLDLAALNDEIETVRQK